MPAPSNPAQDDAVPAGAPAPDSAPPPTDRPIIAFFDVDNTLLRGASVYHLAKGARRRGMLSLGELVKFGWHQARFVSRGENGRVLHGVRERALQLIRGHNDTELGDIATSVYESDIAPRLWPETVDLTREHLAKGHEVWLITAAPLAVASVIAERLGLTGALGTRFESADGVYTGNLLGEVLHGTEKAVEATRLTRELGASLADCWAYSDSRNDIPLLELVGHRVVVNPDVALAHHARAEGWAQLRLKPSSIRVQQRRVRREARESRRTSS